MVIGLSDQELAAVQQTAMNADEARCMTKHSSVENCITWFADKAWPSITAAAKRGEFFTYLEVCNIDAWPASKILREKGFRVSSIHAKGQTTSTITVSWYDE
jgi:hypothetical protein